MRKVKFIPDYRKKETKEGYFHQWGVNYEEFGDVGVGNTTVAIIEDSQGEIHMIYPEQVTFIDKPNTEQK